MDLVRRIAAFPDLLAGAALACEPHRVAFWLQETIAAFHSYYTQGKRTGERFIGADPVKTAARLFLCRALKQVLANGLAVLGVSAPERMETPERLAKTSGNRDIGAGVWNRRPCANRTSARARATSFELSLDGRKVASVVVGALVILGVVFVLGVNVGKQLAAAPRREPGRGRPRRPRPRARAAGAREGGAAHLPRGADEALAAAARAAPRRRGARPGAPVPGPVRRFPRPPPRRRRPPRRARPRSPRRRPTSRGRSSSPRPRTAGRPSGSPRASRRSAPAIEEADVPGKGRFYRVRVGAFDSREAADRYLRDVARETGREGIRHAVPVTAG